MKGKDEWEMLAKAKRELRLARRDIDKPRPEFWEVDKARYRAAKAAVEALSG